MASDESGIRLWKKEARDEQKRFFRNLKKNGHYHELKSPWDRVTKEKSDRRHMNLRRKIGYGFFGPPVKCDYDDENQTGLIETCIEILKGTKTDEAQSVLLAFVMVLCRDQHGEKMTLPILRFFNQAENQGEFVDRNGNRYSSWEEILHFLRRTHLDCCYPENGIYTDDKDNIKYLDSDLSIPVEKLEKSSRFVQDIPDLLQPHKMEITEIDFYRFCSSVGFFFNYYCKEKELWEWVEQVGNAVLQEVQENLSEEDKHFWKKNWQDRLISPRTKAYVLKCLGETEAKHLIRVIRQAKVTDLAFQEKGLLNINHQILISPQKIKELLETDEKELCEILQTVEPKKLKAFSKKERLTFEFQKQEYQNTICKVLKSECQSLCDFENIEINDVVISNEISQPYQLESLHRTLNLTCNQRHPKLVGVGLRLIKMQKFRKIEDMYNALEFAVAHIEKCTREKADAYHSELQVRNQKEVNEMFGINNNEKPKKHFLENEIKEINQDFKFDEMNRNFNQSQLECSQLCEKYPWRFDRNSSGAYHHLKHGESEDLSLEEYFERIHKVYKQKKIIEKNQKIKDVVKSIGEIDVVQEVFTTSENTEIEFSKSTTQEGDAVCYTLIMDGEVLVLYQRKISSPDGALESDYGVATFHFDKKKKSQLEILKQLPEAVEPSLIERLIKKCLPFFFCLVLLFYALVLFYMFFYSYFSLPVLFDVI